MRDQLGRFVLQVDKAVGGQLAKRSSAAGDPPSVGRDSGGRQPRARGLKAFDDLLRATLRLNRFCGKAKSDRRGFVVGARQSSRFLEPERVSPAAD